jgi:hypothetical protein
MNGFRPGKPLAVESCPFGLGSSILRLELRSANEVVIFQAGLRD